MKFINRFDIEVGQDEARKRFVNRAYNRIYKFFYNIEQNERYRIHIEIVSALGEKYSYGVDLSHTIGNEFYRNLLAIETMYECVDYHSRKLLDILIKLLMHESEVDLGIRWTKGRFIKSGAKLLDNKLVNNDMDWLRENKYITVLTPFEKGLNHFLHSDKRPELLSDVITDMYESLEALSKIITKHPKKDLSANRELFLSKIKASDVYKKILSEYINYANEFRHASEE
ncbi:MAG: hypothetical protein NTW80_04230, partial [Deltaproteobacteria bacterium]|nr:hypothetical protein [Deltaproteobacteria bacterium]